MNSRCNCLSLRQATRRVTQLYDRALAPIDLRATQYSLLVRIDQLGPIALNALAEAMVMDRATLGHNVRPLEARGLVRIQTATDRRSREVSLTAAGRSLLTKGQKLWRQAQRTFEDEVGSDTAATLRALLDQISSAEFELNRVE